MKLDASLDRIERESARLDALIGQMLRLSRLEAGTDPEPLVQTDLSELIGAIVDDARFEAQAKGCAVHFESAGDALVEMRPEVIYGACENVIRNAVKFTAPGSRVEVRLDAPSGSDRVRLRVADRGPGIAPDEREAIFTPFHRGPSGRRVDGFGLGLAIARQAVGMHGGTIRADNRDGGGLCVEIVLPRAQLAHRTGSAHA